MTAPNILLLHVHSDRNAGDAALTLSAIDQLMEQFPGARISLAMNDPDSFSGSQPVVLSFLAWIEAGSSRQKARFLRLALSGTLAAIAGRLLRSSAPAAFLPSAIRPMGRALLQADLAVCTPGGYFFSYGTGKALAVLTLTMALALLAGKPLYLLPQSVGPFQSGRERRFAGWVLKRARLIMVREPASLEILERCGVPQSRCHLLPDMAFAFEAAPDADACDWLQAHGVELQDRRPRLGLTVIDWNAQYPGFERQQNYEDAIVAAVADFINRRQAQVYFFPQSYGPSAMEDDRLPAERIAARLDGAGNAVRVFTEPLPPRRLKALFGQMDLFVGTRMHSNIFALGMGVPVIAIGYLHKTRGIARTAGIEDWVMDINTVDGPMLAESLERIWNRREDVKNHLSRRIPALASEARQAGVILAGDYAQYLKGHTISA